MEQIIDRINQDIWKDVTQLPSQPVLSKLLHVSRPTLREALKMLQNMKIVESRNGVGTFVHKRPDKIQNPLSSLTSTGHMIKCCGYHVGSTDCTVVHGQGQPEWRKNLRLEKHQKVVALTRKRTANAVPVAWATNIFPEHLIQNIFDDGFSEGIFRTLQDQCGLEITYAYTQIKTWDPLSAIDQKAHALLGGPVVLLEQLHFDTRNRPVLFSLDYIRTDLVEIKLTRTREPVEL